MAPRQTARRILVAAPALALAFAVAACSPNQEPADPDAPYTLPTYSEESAPHSSIPETQETDDPDTIEDFEACLLYTSPSPRDRTRSRMPSSA